MLAPIQSSRCMKLCSAMTVLDLYLAIRSTDCIIVLQSFFGIMLFPMDHIRAYHHSGAALSEQTRTVHCFDQFCSANAFIMSCPDRINKVNIVIYSVTGLEVHSLLYERAVCHRLASPIDLTQVTLNIH